MSRKRTIRAQGFQRVGRVRGASFDNKGEGGRGDGKLEKKDLVIHQNTMGTCTIIMAEGGGEIPQKRVFSSCR